MTIHHLKPCATGAPQKQVVAREMTIQRVQSLISQYIHLKAEMQKNAKQNVPGRKIWAKNALGPRGPILHHSCAIEQGVHGMTLLTRVNVRSGPNGFLKLHQGFANRKKTGTAKDGSIIDLEKVHAKDECVAYWRPGGHNMEENFYYNGVLTNIYEVILPGRDAPVEVVAIN